MPESSLEDIRSFVAGDMTPEAFRDRLYADSSYEPLLTNDPNLRPGTYVGQNVYLFLLELDFSDISDVFTAQGALAQFMERNGITFTKTDKYEKLYDLILSAQPKWLHVDAHFVCEHIVSQAGDRTGTDLKKWLRAEILKRFKYASRPPRWIQSPAWPIREGQPLVFLGQFAVHDYFHDEASVFVFHDPRTGVCDTIIQVY
jgi:hypothetical protein